MWLCVAEEIHLAFDELARLSGRTRDELMVEVLDEYLAAKRLRIASIQEGERDLKEGRFRDHAAVIAHFKERGLLDMDYVPFTKQQRD